MLPKHFTELSIGVYLKKKNLINRDIPIAIIRLLVRWYASQLYHVRWGVFSYDGFTSRATKWCCASRNSFSAVFLMYIDDLSIALSNSKYGCTFGGCSFNNLSYVDDMVILSPSATAL